METNSIISATSAAAFSSQNFPTDLDEDRLFLKHRKSDECLSQDLKDLFAPYNKLCEKDKFFRTFSSCGISNVDSKNEIDIASKSLEFQEKLLINDLIFVLQGVEGEYIRISEKDNKKLILSIDPSFDSALRTLVYRIMPLAIDFDKVVNFCRKFGLYVKGLIIQAYCSSLKILIEEYLTLISQLEFQPSMSVQKLYLYIQPVQKTMRLLAEFCEQISKSNAHGGGVLSYLHKKCTEFSGDKSATDLCNFLLNYASRPYFKMLERWLYFGEIFDTYSEFMIRENIDPKKKLPSGAAFDEIENWEYRYYVKVEMCPSNLTSVADKILNCGKYLNIITSCDSKTETDFLSQLPVKRLSDIQNERNFVQEIEQIYTFASKSLMKLLTDQFNLIGYFKSIKHYFLIDQGDWLLHFLDLADDEELKLNLEDVRLHRLESFLDLAIRSSLLANDALKDEIKLNLKSTSLTNFLSLLLNIDQEIAAPSKKTESQYQNLKACDALTLKFDAQWPLSIIFNRKVMLQYEIIFRRLLQCKYVEKLLSRCWISRKFRSNPLYSLLLHQMLTFLKNYLYFATAEVIEPNWHKFYANFSTIDQALKSHALFLDDTTKDCLLTDGVLVQNFQKVLDICLKFAKKFDENLDDTTRIEDLKSEFDRSQMNMLQRMQILSASSKERLYTDIAYRLDLK